MSKKTRRKRNRKNKKQPQERNWLAVHAFQRSGAGKHKSKATYSRKSKHKKSYA